MDDISKKVDQFEKVRTLPLAELARVAIHQESVAISPRTTPMIEIARSLADENDRLRALVAEMIDVYWGEGDSDPHNPPDIIKRARRALKA